MCFKCFLKMLKVKEKVGVAVVKNVALQNFGNDAEREKLVYNSQSGWVVLTVQMQRSSLVPRREGRFSLPQNVPSGEERSRRVCCIRKLGRPGFLNADETSKRFRFARTAPSDKDNLKSLHTEGTISDAVHPGISSDTQALLGSRLFF